MLFFIDFLRMLATMLITNSHYEGVYPSDLLANGGLLGNVLFFAISGFCLSNIKLPLHSWLLKRVIRIYPIVWTMTIFNCLVGRYQIFTFFDIIKLFIYPTAYAFIGAIILLYIPYYLVVRSETKFSKCGYNIKSSISIYALLSIMLMQLVTYVFFYDKSYYHIDAVVEPMILFLYFEAMLIGYIIRTNPKYFNNMKSYIKWFLLAVLFVGYFASKLIFAKFKSVAALQIVNQYVLLLLMVFIFVCISSMGKYLDLMPGKIKKIITFIAQITLEIYVVQSIIIQNFKHIVFPLNWLIITILILASAICLHFVIKIPSLLQHKIKSSKK